MQFTDELAEFHEHLRSANVPKTACVTAVDACLRAGKILEALYILDIAQQRFPKSRYFARYVATLVDTMHANDKIDEAMEVVRNDRPDIAALHDGLIATFTPIHSPASPRPASDAFLQCVIMKNLSVALDGNDPDRSITQRFAEHFGRLNASEVFGVPAAPTTMSGSITRADIGEKTARFHVPNAFSIHRLSFFYLQEPGLFRLIATFREDDVFLDIGANIGIYSILAAAIKGCRTFAVEPFSVNHEALQRNIALNGLKALVTPLRVAISDQTNEGILSFSTRDSGAANNTFEEANPEESPADANTERVVGYRLDDLIAAGAIAFPSHIKIEVDGTEHRIIAGMPDTLADQRLRSIRLEIDLSDPRNAAALTTIEQAGFTCRADDDEKNLLCLRDDAMLASPQ